MAKKLADRKGLWSKKIIASRNKNKVWKHATEKGRIEAKKNPSMMRKARDAKGLRQVDLAKIVKMKGPSLASVERGKRGVKRDNAFAIARELGDQVQNLFAQRGKKFVAIIK